MDWLGNQINRFTEFSLLEWQFGLFASFVLVLGHSESELYPVYLFEFPTL